MIDFNDLPQDKIYFQEDDVVIYCADCREILPKLPKVDLVLTDPPYGINLMGASGGHLGLSRKSYEPIVDDDITIDLAQVLAKSDKSIIFGGNYFNLPISKSWIVWDKVHFAERTYADVELIWTNLGMPARLIKCQWDGFTRKGEIEDKQHPTQKPVELIGKLIESYSKEGDLILDPYLGSGTTAYCAKKLGRKCIGIEISEKYCEIAKNRLRQSVMKL